MICADEDKTSRGAYEYNNNNGVWTRGMIIFLCLKTIKISNLFIFIPGYMLTPECISKPHEFGGLGFFRIMGQEAKCWAGTCWHAKFPPLLFVLCMLLANNY